MSRPLELESNVRSIAHLRQFLDELRTRSTELVQSIDPQARGYFTPSEDEQSRRLLISYWNVRNALADLLDDCRREAQEGDLAPESPEYQALFLVGFAASLLLIDAARFLRETAQQYPLVREKLNEPAPSFDIPANVYDQVQHSLVSSRNAWRMYHAIRYFEREEAVLRERASSQGWQPLLDTIDSRQHRLEVSLGTFAKARMRTRGGAAVNRVTISLAKQAIYGMQKLSGSLLSEKYVRPNHRPGLPDDIERSLRTMLEPGDVLVTRKEYALTNYFLPGYWPHAALYLGTAEELSEMGAPEREHVRPRWPRICSLTEDDPAHVLESMRDGVQLRGLASPFASDSVVVLRPKLKPDQIADAIGRVMKHEGKGYDFDFDFRRADRLVCTEVVYRAYDGVGPMNFALTNRAGRPTLSGGDLIHMGIGGQQFRTVAVYAPQLRDGIQTAEPALELMETAMSE